MCEWFGLPELDAREHALRGRSLLALLDSYVRRPFAHRPVLAESTGPAPVRALRTRELAVVESTGSAGTKLALFDRVADPGERFDLSAARPELTYALAR